MIFTPTRLEDAYLIDVERHADERGFLARTFCEREFAGARPADAHRAEQHDPQPAARTRSAACTTRRRRTGRSSWCAARAARSSS